MGPDSHGRAPPLGHASQPIAVITFVPYAHAVRVHFAADAAVWEGARPRARHGCAGSQVNEHTHIPVCSAAKSTFHQKIGHLQPLSKYSWATLCVLCSCVQVSAQYLKYTKYTLPHHNACSTCCAILIGLSLEMGEIFYGRVYHSGATRRR